MNRDFKGIWIPEAIWLLPELSLQAKVLWAEIDSLYCKESGGCFASNKYLMRFMGVKISRLHEVLKELKDNHLIVNVNADGESRIIQAVGLISKEQDVDPKQSLESQKNGLKRDFKGIWIPKEVWLLPELSLQAKVLWAEIDSLYCKESGGCFASDEYLMQFMGVKISRLHEILKELKDNRFLVNVNKDKRNRVMKAVNPKVTGSLTSGKPDGGGPENRKSNFQETGSPIYKEYNKEENKEEREREASASLPPISSGFSAKMEQKRSYGELKNVKLTQTEHEKLLAKLGKTILAKIIKRVDLYVAQSGKRYKSHYATILKWLDDDLEKTQKTIDSSVAKHRQGSKLAFETEKDTWKPPELKPRKMTLEEKDRIKKEFGVG